jgi:sugar fermentation stimulation protein A
MRILKLYNTYEEAFFLERPNRFVMLLQTKAGRTIRAHVPNTGRMEEFCLDRHPFFLTPVTGGKYPYKVVATTYQNAFVFLDTIKVNTLFFHLLTGNYIPQFQNAARIRREVPFGDSKFDFTFEHHHRNVIVEIKSCTLCHDRLAMFPDAPTLRGQKHLAGLERLARDTGYDTYVIFLILNAGAERFMPNFHTDFDYAKLFLAANHVNLNAFRLSVIDPVSVDLESLRPIPADRSTLQENCKNKGSYLLLLENPEAITICVGKLGEIHFPQGWYVYVGSALNSLDSRLKRHQQKRKKRFWHIDYIASTIMKVKRVYPIRRSERMESQLSRALGPICDQSIPGFGASDTRERSHLFYFSTYPLRSRAFVNVIFNARTLCHDSIWRTRFPIAGQHSFPKAERIKFLQNT